MTYQPEAIRIADGLDQNVQIDPQTSEDEPGGYRSELDELMADAAAILRSQHTRIAELEAMLDAVGAGGVGQSIKPQVQPDTAQAPVALVKVLEAGGNAGIATRIVEIDDPMRERLQPGTKLYTAPQPTENLRCKSTQKRLATLWGYEKARQPLTDVEVYDLIVSVCSDGSAPSFQEAKEEAPLTFEFARAVEAAHGITGGQQ